MTTSNEKPPDEQIEVSNYEELISAILDLISEHESSGQLIINNYDGENVQTDVARARREIMFDHPVGAYAVAEITGVVTRIVSYFEVDIGIEYKRTRQQIDSIVNVSTLRYLRTELLSVMSDYRDEVVFRTTLQITEEDIVGFVEETYYQNPRRIVILPVTVVETFPLRGEDRIFELHLGYADRASILRKNGENLALYVRRNALLAVGDNDAEILLSLVENLVAASLYDAGAARAISVHGAQNWTVTAHGALANGRAVGEGFAMAFKALCDELGFECHVVLGYLNGMIHAWNIVSLNEEYYHIDVAMCDLNGIETAFLKTDLDFIGRYTWDMESTERCNGTLTYEDIVGPEDPEDPEELEDDGDEGGPGNPGEGTGEAPNQPGGETAGTEVDSGEQTESATENSNEDTTER